MRRNRNKIKIKMLRVASNGVRLTPLIYRANLNFKSVKSFIKELQEAKLLNKIELKHIIYKTTPKGELLLIRYNMLIKDLNGE